MYRTHFIQTRNTNGSLNRSVGLFAPGAPPLATPHPQVHHQPAPQQANPTPQVDFTSTRNAIVEMLDLLNSSPILAIPAINEKLQAISTRRDLIANCSVLIS